MMLLPAPVRPFIASAIGLASTLAGASLAFRLVTPGHVRALQTAELLGLLGLVLLPPVILTLVLLHRLAPTREHAQTPTPEPRTLTPALP